MKARPGGAPTPAAEAAPAARPSRTNGAAQPEGDGGDYQVTIQSVLDTRRRLLPEDSMLQTAKLLASRSDTLMLIRQQPWTGVVFTARGSGGREHEGAVPGTFALEFAHLGGSERSPDIVFTFPWSSVRNRQGVPNLDV